MSPRALSRDEEQRLYGVKTYIVKHLHEKLTIAELAQKAAMGPRNFRYGFYLLFGMHPGGYVYETRKQTARFLLTHTDKPVAKVARLCGYGDYKSFARAYQRWFGTWPIDPDKRKGRVSTNFYIG